MTYKLRGQKKKKKSTARIGVEGGRGYVRSSGREEREERQRRTRVSKDGQAHVCRWDGADINTYQTNMIMKTWLPHPSYETTASGQERKKKKEIFMIFFFFFFPFFRRLFSFSFGAPTLDRASLKPSPSPANPKCGVLLNPMGNILPLQAKAKPVHDKQVHRGGIHLLPRCKVMLMI